MKNFFVLTLLTLAYLLSSAIVAMDENHVTAENLFAYADKKQWDLFKQSLASYDGPLSRRDAQGYTLLHRAVLDNLQDCVEGLIKKGAPLTSSYVHNSVIDSRQKKTIIAPPLHYSIQTGNLPIIQMLINADKKVIQSNECEFKNTPLHLAAWFNQALVVPILINNGANIDSPNDLGSTPTHLAVWRNSSASLTKLLEYDPLITQKNTTGKGNTPLYLAAKAGSQECVAILLKHLHIQLWLLGDFLAHLNQKCAGDNSIAVQAAGIRENAQCYWDLVVAGGDYTTRLYNKNTQQKESISEIVHENRPLKNFIETIEKKGKDNPPRYNGKASWCFICCKDYNHNDVIMTLELCTHSCHAHCFKDYLLNCFIQKNRNNPKVKDVLEKEPIFETKHRLLTHPLKQISWNLVDSCPTCQSSIDVAKEGKLAVFLAH